MANTTKYRFTDEKLAEAVSKSVSVAGVMRLLGIRWAGGSHAHVRRRIDRAGIDRTHFTGKASNRGKQPANRRPWSEWLVDRSSEERRLPADRLRRCLIESGREHKCHDCGMPAMWHGSPMNLEIDHENGNWLDDRPENLNFRCPNCHTVKTKKEIEAAKAARRNMPK